MAIWTLLRSFVIQKVERSDPSRPDTTFLGVDHVRIHREHVYNIMFARTIKIQVRLRSEVERADELGCLRYG
jgi:hypothetical protein